MKRGISNQIFYYIFAVIVIAFILAFGSDIINKVFSYEGDVGVATFKQDIERKMNLVYDLNSGSTISLEDVNVPRTVEEICFKNGGFEVNGEFKRIDYVKVNENFCVNKLNNIILKKEGDFVEVRNGPAV